MTDIHYDLPCYYVSGDAASLGSAAGHALSARVQAFVAQRLRAAKVYLWERGSRDLDGFLALGDRCYEVFCAWDPLGAAEHDALAHGAGVSPQELYTATNMTDIRDVLLVELAAAGVSAPSADSEGCSALLIGGQRSRSGQLIVGQTWDLNPQDVDDIVAIHRRPDDQPATWTVTCNGCPTLVGINEHGLCVGTTNIKTDDARVGVGYLSILHRAIRSRSVAEAAAIVASAPRAAAHTYWLADAGEARLLTCSASDVYSETLDPTGCLAQTNHLRQQPRSGASLEAPTTSTLARLCHLEDWAQQLAATDPAATEPPERDMAALRQLFADRSQGSDSINRYPEDGTGTATDACFVATPATRACWACRGPADRGLWYHLDVDAGTATPLS